MDYTSLPFVPSDISPCCLPPGESVGVASVTSDAVDSTEEEVGVKFDAGTLVGESCLKRKSGSEALLFVRVCQFDRIWSEDECYPTPNPTT